MKPSAKYRHVPVLVTGATGFVGINLVKRLKSLGAQIHVLTREQADSPHLTDLRKGTENGSSPVIHTADITDFHAVQSAVEKAKPLKVFHLAGKILPARTPEIAKEAMDTNAWGTFNLLRALMGRPLDSFILTSTTEVYGNNRVPFRESQKEDPPSPYAISKVAAEQFSRFFFRTYKLPATVIRMSSCYGPYLQKPRLIASVFSACLESEGGEPLNLTSGKQKRDFVFVEDVVEALTRAAATPEAAGETINVAGSGSYSVREVTEMILSLTDSSPEIRWNTLKSRSNENQVWKTDMTKARKILGWHPETSLRKGLAVTAEWWYDRIERRQAEEPA